VDDNVWEYPFGDLDEDDELFYRKPDLAGLWLHIHDAKPVSSAAFPLSI
jgi:hypothetical protein